MKNAFDYLNSKAIWKCKIPLLSRNDAISFVKLCEMENIKILGIDAFLIYPDGRIQPFLEDSIDYSKSKTNNWNEAIKFLYSKNDKKYHYEIVGSGLGAYICRHKV